jgi:hypothetical protein
MFSGMPAIASPCARPTPDKSASRKLAGYNHVRRPSALARTRVSLAAKKFAGARAAGKVSLIEDDAATGQYGLRHSCSENVTVMVVSTSLGSPSTNIGL